MPNRRSQCGAAAQDSWDPGARHPSCLHQLGFWKYWGNQIRFKSLKLPANCTHVHLVNHMMESSSRKGKRKFHCYSPNCRGKEVSEASFYRHRKRQKILEDLDGLEEVVGHEEFLEEEVLQGAEVVVQEVGAKLHGVDFVDGKIPPPADRDSTLESAMRTQMVLLQSDMDFAKVPVSLQEKIMRRVFLKILLFVSIP